MLQQKVTCLMTIYMLFYTHEPASHKGEFMRNLAYFFNKFTLIYNIVSVFFKIAPNLAPSPASAFLLKHPLTRPNLHIEYA